MIVSVQTDRDEELAKPIGPSIVATSAPDERAGLSVVAIGNERGYVEKAGSLSVLTTAAVSEMT